MNKDNQLEFITQQRKEHAGPTDEYREGYFKCLDDFENKIQSEPEETCYSNYDCEMKQDDKCTMFGPCPHLHKEVSLHDIIYDFITQYSGGVSLSIDTQDGELLKDYINDYLKEKAGE